MPAPTTHNLQLAYTHASQCHEHLLPCRPSVLKFQVRPVQHRWGLPPLVRRGWGWGPGYRAGWVWGQAHPPPPTQLAVPCMHCVPARLQFGVAALTPASSCPSSAPTMVIPPLAHRTNPALCMHRDMRRTPCHTSTLTPPHSPHSPRSPPSYCIKCGLRSPRPPRPLPASSRLPACAGQPYSLSHPLMYLANCRLPGPTGMARSVRTLWWGACGQRTPATTRHVTTASTWAPLACSVEFSPSLPGTPGKIADRGYVIGNGRHLM